MTHLPPPVPPRRKRNTAPLLIGIAIVFTLCCIGGIVLVALDKDDDGANPAASAPASAAPAANPADVLTKAITDKLGKVNRDGVPAPKVTSWPDDPQKTIDVEWALNDNLTANLRKVGARSNVLEILKAVKAKATWKYTQVRLTGTFSMVDKYGNTAETAVIKLTYSADTIAKIDPDGLTSDRIYDLADSQQVHPEFR